MYEPVHKVNGSYHLSVPRKEATNPVRVARWKVELGLITEKKDGVGLTILLIAANFLLRLSSQQAIFWSSINKQRIFERFVPCLNSFVKKNNCKNNKRIMLGIYQKSKYTYYLYGKKPFDTNCCVSKFKRCNNISDK